MFSIVMSAFFNSSLTISRPRGDFKFTVSDFLLALNWWKYHGSLSGAPGPASRRPGSPTPGFSILTTSAPSQASDSVHDGPASNWVKSTTLMPSRQSSSTPKSVISSPPSEEILLRDQDDRQYERQGAERQTNPQAERFAIERAEAEDREQRGERYAADRGEAEHGVALQRVARGEAQDDDQRQQRR